MPEKPESSISEDAPRGPIEIFDRRESDLQCGFPKTACRTGGLSRFGQSGDIPGDMWTPNLIEGHGSHYKPVYEAIRAELGAETERRGDPDVERAKYLLERSAMGIERAIETALGIGSQTHGESTNA